MEFDFSKVFYCSRFVRIVLFFKSVALCIARRKVSKFLNLHKVFGITETSEEAVPVEIEEELLVLPSEIPNNDNRPLLPRQRRQKRVRTRPLAPLDEARRILSQVEMQRAAADAASAEGLQNIGLNLGRLANIAEQYFQYIVSLRPA
ncbi:uncharacterized protein LOC121737347 [Aricia agestis]|uniref:uncharacterized protein LOC121737347 n=1 Tax=Aricia agestis TaxID=91739 RepID=UPI001C207741|nr:uncharacterized protein LOC121727582 isoform X1 [Aricia agestis]XP_041984946.1 uncharacterized protein LOC121737347 [Aricia agestis]